MMLKSMRINREKKLQAKARQKLVAEIDELLLNWSPRFVEAGDVASSIEDKKALSDSLYKSLANCKEIIASMLFADNAMVWNYVSAIEQQLPKIKSNLSTYAGEVSIRLAIQQIETTLRQWANL